VPKKLTTHFRENLGVQMAFLGFVLAKFLTQILILGLQTLEKLFELLDFLGIEFALQ
jgi:hypothetical protein